MTRTPYKVQREKPVTQWVLYANAATFVVLYRQGGLFRALAKNDAMIRRGGLQSYRLLSACFLHANLPHLLVNSNSLNALGSSVEPWFGSRRTAYIYAAAGLSGNYFSFRTGMALTSVGASTSIFGLLGAWAVFLQTNREFFARGGVNVGRSLRSLMESCVLTAAIGMAPGSMIDNAGHLGGLLGGAAAAYAIGPRLRRTPYGFTVDEPLVRLPGRDAKQLPSTSWRKALVPGAMA